MWHSGYTKKKRKQKQFFTAVTVVVVNNIDFVSKVVFVVCYLSFSKLYFIYENKK